MKNPYNEINDEIRNWLESRGYAVYYSYGVGKISVVINNQISAIDLKEFKNDFNSDLTLNGVVFNEFGEKSEFHYNYDSSCLNDFKLYVHNWLKRHNFPVDYIFCSDEIRAYFYEKLSDSQINDFEKEFEVKCRKFKISCGVNEFEYIFS